MAEATWKNYIITNKVASQIELRKVCPDPIKIFKPYAILC